MYLPRLILSAALLALAAPSIAAEPPARQSTLVVYGDDPCPQAEGGDEDEIVICARKPEEERYRIPPNLRERPDDPSEVSWASRIDQLDEGARAMRPNSCSVVGSGGQTGCTQAMIRQWYDERRLRRTQESGVP